MGQAEEGIQALKLEAGNQKILKILKTIKTLKSMGAAGLSVLDMLSLRILNREQQLAVVFNPVLQMPIRRLA